MGYIIFALCISLTVLFIWVVALAIKLNNISKCGYIIGRDHITANVTKNEEMWKDIKEIKKNITIIKYGHNSFSSSRFPYFINIKETPIKEEIMNLNIQLRALTKYLRLRYVTETKETKPGHYVRVEKEGIASS